MQTKIFSVLSVVFLIFAIACPSSAAPDKEIISVSGKSAVLYEPSGDILIFQKNAREKRGMASTTKIMTALVAIENADLDEMISIPREAVGVEGSSLYLQEGELLSLRELLYGLMLQSANDSAVAIAISVSGSVEKFTDLMNERAQTMGLSNTHFTNPHGLSDSDHYTTAADLAKIAATALRNPVFADIVSTSKAVIGRKTDNPRGLYNHNKLLSYYPGAIGVKTGFTRATGRCLVGAAEKDGMLLVSVTLDAPDDWNDHKKLLDLGFQSYERKLLANENEISCEISLLNGKKATVKCCNKKEIYAVLPKDNSRILANIEANRYAAAPVSKGDILGAVYYYLDGKKVAFSPLYAIEDSPAATSRKNFFEIFFK